MREAPDFVSGEDVLDAVRVGWAIEDAELAIEHLPVGFGAHHWRVSAGRVPRLM
jgi:spectinomycin phosphotransferase